MPDFLEYLLRPFAGTLLAVARFLLWLGWDFMVQTVGWTVGWLVLRALTFGNFPRERLGEMDYSPYAVLVDLFGLACLAGIVALLIVNFDAPRLAGCDFLYQITSSRITGCR